MSETRTRTFTLERKAGKDNVFPAVATTEAPVLRDGYYEVLDMDRIDLSRAPLPFIESHDTQTVNIGVAENVRVDGDKLRCDVRLGTSARAKELAEDIRSGIVSGLSIGYQVSEPVNSGERDDYPIYRFKFTPTELSAVSVPADTNAGFFRSENIIMENEDKLTRSERKRANAIDSGVDELGRTREEQITCIRSIVDRHDLGSMGVKALAENWSVSKVQDEALKVVGERSSKAKVTTDPTYFAENYAGMGGDTSVYGRAMDDYSVLTVLRNLADPAKAVNSLEMEISEQMKRDAGKQSAPSMMIPYEALQTRAVTASGSGSNLIGTDHLAGNFIDVLRNKSQVMKLNPTILHGLVGDVAIPRQSGTTTATWFAADGSDEITDSDPAMDQVTLSPNFVGGATTFSRKMLIQSAPGIEQLIRNDLSGMIAVELDAKALAGDGTGNTPTGVLNMSGINALDFAAANPTFAEIVAMETLIADDNADDGTLAYLTTPSLRQALKTTPKQGSGVEGNFVLEGGMVNGFRCLSSKNVTASYMILADWSQLFIGMWGGVELDADPYGSNFLKGSITVRILTQMDVAVRHPEAFCIGSENVTP